MINKLFVELQRYVGWKYVGLLEIYQKKQTPILIEYSGPAVLNLWAATLLEITYQISCIPDISIMIQNSYEVATKLWLGVTTHEKLY